MTNRNTCAAVLCVIVAAGCSTAPVPKPEPARPQPRVVAPVKIQPVKPPSMPKASNLETIRKRAEGGDAYNQAALCEILRRGEYGTTVDEVAALAWARKSADQNHSLGLFNLARFFTKGMAGVARNEERAQSLYKACVAGVSKLADQGDARAQFNLGCLYEEGLGVERDAAKGLLWCRKAAEQGFGPAECGLGVDYENGKGVKQDYAEALRWYLKAAAQGNSSAKCNIGILYRYGKGVKQSYEDAFKWHMKAAAQADARAQTSVGYAYQYGLGVARDSTEAAKWYRLGADQGLAAAQYNLGCLYNDGLGVKQDYQEAFRWYSKAAAQGWLDAMRNLGYLYLYGKGVERDLDQAITWARPFAERGDPAACSHMACAYNEKGDKKQTVEWCRRAIAAGNEDCFQCLASAYFNGEGIEKDLEKSAVWFGKAVRKGDRNSWDWLREQMAKRGEREAQYQVGELYWEGVKNVVVSDPVEALYWHKKAAAQGHPGAQERLKAIKEDKRIAPEAESKVDERLKNEAKPQVRRISSPGHAK